MGGLKLRRRAPLARAAVFVSAMNPDRMAELEDGYRKAYAERASTTSTTIGASMSSLHLNIMINVPTGESIPDARLFFKDKL